MKIANIFGYNIHISLLFFPLTCIINNIITEIYGFKINSIVIWTGLLINIIVVMGCLMSVFIPSADLMSNQIAFETIFKHSPRILFASFIAYFFNGFINSIILSKLKIITQGKYFELRVLISSFVTVILDSIIFCSIAFYKIIPDSALINLIINESIFKFMYELLGLPLVSMLVTYIKQQTNKNIFDFNVNYNPFKIFNFDN